MKRFSHPFSYPILYAVLFLFMTVTGHANAANDEQIELSKWLDSYTVSHISSSRNEIVLEFVNDETLAPELTRHQVQKGFFLVVPSETSTLTEILDYEYDVYRGEAYSTTISPDKTEGIPLPSAAQLIIVDMTDRFRDFYVAYLKVSAMIFTDQGEQGRAMLVLRKVRVRLSFEIPPDAEVDITSVDPFGISLLKHIVVNPGDVERFALPPLNVAAEYDAYVEFADRINQKRANAPVVKCIVYDKGIQAITYQELEGAEIDVKELPLNRIKLFYGNEEVPLHVVRGESKFQFFSPGDTMFFYAPDPLESQHDYDVYWLTVDDAGSTSPARMRYVSLPTEPGASVYTTGSFQKRIYPPQRYTHASSYPNVFSHWYWGEIPMGQFRDFSTYLAGINTETDGCDFKALIGTTERNKSQTYNIYINDRFQDEIKWTGWRTYEYSKKIPMCELKEGENTVSIEVPEQSERGNYSTELLFYGFEVDYKGFLGTDEDRMTFRLQPSTSKEVGRVEFNLARQEENAFVFNISNPRKPYVVKSYPGADARYYYDSLSGTETYWITNHRGAFLPRLVPVEKDLTLLNADLGADYLVISHPSFLNQLTPLTESRINNGLRVHVTDIDEVYDCFSFGCKESYAIQRFVKYVYSRWESPYLRYVLLVGDASDVLGDPARFPAEAQPDLIPVYDHEKPTTFVRADNKYGIVTEGILTDVAIGRFPAQTPDDLTTLIEKTLEYERDMDRYSLWRRRIMFVADDEAEFPEICDFLIKTRIPSDLLPVRVYQHEFPYKNFYRVHRRKQSPQATQQLIDEINRGVLLYFYYGHGGPNIWTAERLFHVFEDLEHFENKQRLSFLASSSCDTAWLDYPIGQVTSSMGELLVKTPDKGCVGVFAPTTGATPTDHKFLMKRFMDGLFEGGLRDFGELFLASKIMFGLERRNSSVLDQFILLGDPSLDFSFQVPEMNELRISSTIINAETGGTIKVLGVLPRADWGWTEVYLIDEDSLEVTAVERYLPITAGVFNGEITLPSTSAGKKNLLFYSYNDYTKRGYTKTIDIDMVEPNLDLTLEYDKSPTFPKVGEEFTLKVLVRNTTELPLDKVDVKVAYGHGNESILDKKIDLPPRGEWASEIRLQGVNPDVTRVSANASLFAQEKAYLEVERIVFIPIASKQDEVTFGFNALEAEVTPQPLLREQKPTLEIPIYNLTDSIKKNVVCEIRPLDSDEVLARFLIDSIPAYSSRKVTFELDTTYSPGNQPLNLAVFQTENKDAPGDLPEDAIAKTLLLEVKDFADIAVVNESLEVRSSHFYNGETAYLDATIINLGEIDVSNIEVAAYHNTPLLGSNLIMPFFSSPGIKTIPLLKPGEKTDITFRWDRFGRSGVFPLYVVVNPNKKFTESNYRNNISGTEITFISEGNLSIMPEDIKLSQSYARRGDKVDVSLTIHNDSDREFHDVMVALEQKAMNKGSIPVGQPLFIDRMPPRSNVTKTVTWEVGELYDQIKVMLNPRETLNEDNYDDNIATARINYIVPIFDLEKPSDGDTDNSVYPFHQELFVGSNEATIIQPGYTISPSKFFHAPEIRVPLEMKYIMNQDVVETGKEEEEKFRDGRWFLHPERDGWLESSPWEDVPPVNITIPVPDTSTNFYDLYIVVQTNEDYRGYPGTKIKMKLENETSFKVRDYSLEPKPWYTQSYYLGRYHVYDSFLDLTIDDVKGSYWAVINRIDFVPLKGVYTSPVIDLSKAWKTCKDLKLGFDLRLPDEYTTVDILYRISAKEDINEWSEWQPVNLTGDHTSQSIVPEGRYLQWKATLFSSDTNSPQIKRAWLHIQK